MASFLKENEMDESLKVRNLFEEIAKDPDFTAVYVAWRLNDMGEETDVDEVMEKARVLSSLEIKDSLGVIAAEVQLNEPTKEFFHHVYLIDYDEGSHELNELGVVDIVNAEVGIFALNAIGIFELMSILLYCVWNGA